MAPNVRASRNQAWGFVAATSEIRSERLHRAESMVARIARDYALDWDDVLAQATPGATIGRPHIADALVARGHVSDRSAAFQTILHWQGGYYRPHEAPLPVENQCVTPGPVAISGTFSPDQPLNRFDGSPLAGAWELRIFDSNANNAGTLVNWCLRATLQ